MLSTWHLGGEEPDEVTLRAGHVPKLRYNREKGYLKGLNGAGGLLRQRGVSATRSSIAARM